MNYLDGGGLDIDVGCKALLLLRVAHFRVKRRRFRDDEGLWIG